jgi:hypothetical protein
MECVYQIWSVCFVTPTSAGDASIFRFGDFITALALLVIVYTVADVRYRFRLAIAPTIFHLYVETFVLIGVIGGAALLTDIWLVERWPVPETVITQSIWRGMFGLLFLSLAMTWMWYAFIWPPIFGKRNYLRFINSLYNVVVRGSNEDLPVIANELTRSAQSLIKYSRLDRPAWAPEQAQTPNQRGRKSKPAVNDIAHDVLLLMGNRKLCRHIVESSSVTAIALLEAAANSEKAGLPLGQFAINISTEAIANKDSVLYHEDQGSTAGLTGYLKPFSQAVYGNYPLVESLGSHFGSPLDVRYERQRDWDATQLKAYCSATTITIKDYLKRGYWGRHSYALYRALGNIEGATSDFYKLNKATDDFYSTDPAQRMEVVVDFIHEVVDVFDKTRPVPAARLRIFEKTAQNTLYDHIANMMFEVIFDASKVSTPPDNCWIIHHNMVWCEFFALGQQGKAWKIVHFKLRRLLFEEIVLMDKVVNYKSARILGYCLNVMGLTLARGKAQYERGSHALHRVVLAWARRNYLRILETNPEVAEACLIGSITYDASRVSLVKTYAKGLDREPAREYLALTYSAAVQLGGAEGGV